MILLLYDGKYIVSKTWREHINKNSFAVDNMFLQGKKLRSHIHDEFFKKIVLLHQYNARYHAAHFTLTTILRYDVRAGLPLSVTS